MSAAASVAGSSPYAWPYDGRIAPAHMALVVCGAIGHWAAKTPLDPVAEANLDRLRVGLGASGGFVALVRHDMVRGQASSDEPDRPTGDLSPTASERVVSAAGTDGFYGGPLDAVLRRANRTHLLVCGRGYETAVHSTLRRANDRGDECLTVVDACASIDPTLRTAATSTIEMSGGIFGAVATTAATLDALATLDDPATVDDTAERHKQEDQP